MNITKFFGISGKDEEAKFVKKLENIQKYIDRRYVATDYLAIELN